MPKMSGKFLVVHSGISTKGGLLKTEGAVLEVSDFGESSKEVRPQLERLLQLGAIRELSEDELDERGLLIDEESESALDRLDELMREPQFTTGNETVFGAGTKGFDGDLDTGAFSDNDTEPQSQEVKTQSEQGQAQNAAQDVQANLAAQAATRARAAQQSTEVRFANDAGAQASDEAKKQEAALERQAAVAVASAQPDASKKSDALEDKAVVELKEIARGLGVQGIHQMNKQDLVDAINKVKK